MGLSLQTPLTHLIYIAWLILTQPKILTQVVIIFLRIDCRWGGIHFAERKKSSYSYSPGPLNLPTTSLVLSFFIPALTSKFLSLSPQQSSLFLIVTLVIVSLLLSCIRNQGLSSVFEWNIPSCPGTSFPSHANIGELTLASWVDDAQKCLPWIPLAKVN